MPSDEGDKKAAPKKVPANDEHASAEAMTLEAQSDAAERKPCKKPQAALLKLLPSKTKTLRKHESRSSCCDGEIEAKVPGDGNGNASFWMGPSPSDGETSDSAEDSTQEPDSADDNTLKNQATGRDLRRNRSTSTCASGGSKLIVDIDDKVEVHITLKDLRKGIKPFRDKLHPDDVDCLNRKLSRSCSLDSAKRPHEVTECSKRISSFKLGGLIPLKSTQSSKRKSRERYSNSVILGQLMRTKTQGLKIQIPETECPRQKSGWLTFHCDSDPKKCAGQKLWVELNSNLLVWYKKNSCSDDKGLEVVGKLDLGIVRVVCEIIENRKTNIPPPAKDLGGKKKKKDPGSSKSNRKETGKSHAPTRKQDSMMASFVLHPGGCQQDKRLEFTASNCEDAQEWVDILRQHCRRPRKSNLQAQVIDSRHMWSEVKHISPAALLDCVETGDILLFQSIGTIPQATRLATNGCYDHVAMFMRIGDKGDVGFLEAVTNGGVGFVHWENFISNDWQNIYSQIAVRRVHFPRTKEVLERLQIWSQDVIGKPYSLNIKVVAAVRAFQGLIGGRKVDKNAKSYFCSQLVAEGLKELGVLRPDQSTIGFVPSSFEQPKSPGAKEYGSYVDGCGLGMEVVIDFNLGDVNRIVTAHHLRRKHEGRQKKIKETATAVCAANSFLRRVKEFM